MWVMAGQYKAVRSCFKISVSRILFEVQGNVPMPYADTAKKDNAPEQFQNKAADEVEH